MLSGICGKPGASRAASGRENARAGRDPSGPEAAARVVDWIGVSGGGSAVGDSAAVRTKACERELGLHLLPN
jgi:hypothetical protein